MFKSNLSQLGNRFKENLKNFFRFHEQEKVKIEKKKEKEPEKITRTTSYRGRNPRSRHYGKNHHFEWNMMQKCFGTFSPVRRFK